MIEDVINLWFNPTDAVSTYRSAKLGILILACRLRGIAETERIRDQEHVAEVTRGTRLLNEAIKLTKTNTRLPASTFYELRHNVGTFCAFLFMLFGSKCDYYQKMLNIKKILDDPRIQAIYKTYSITVCRHIVWAIICNGQFIFNKVNLSQDLVSGNWRDPPRSLLSLIMDKVMFAEVIHRLTFPCKWEISTQPQQPGYMQKTDGKAPQNGDKLMHPGAGDRTQTNPGAQSIGTKWIHPRKLRHSIIKALIDPVLAKVGNCFAIWDILRGGNVSINDLPRLPKYQDSSRWSTVCWTNVLRGCTCKDCPFKLQGGHVACEYITDGFADAVCDKLGKGVMYIMSQEQGERTAKKTKTMTGAATNLTATQE